MKEVVQCLNTSVAVDLYQTFKCPCELNCDFNLLLFREQLDFLTHLAKFQSITNIRSRFISTFISVNLWPPFIKLVPRQSRENVNLSARLPRSLLF